MTHPSPRTLVKPPWLKVRAPGGERYARIKGRLRELSLHTVCEEAHCPNMGECWGGGTATIMLMGDVCTRGCRFCAVTSGVPRALDADEPTKVATAVAEMELDYIVLTSVDRDDLPDGGADHYARTVEALKARCPELLVEVLTPDFRGDDLAIARLVRARPDVFAHNLETTRRLHRTVRDVRAGYGQSLRVLERARALAEVAGHRMLTKTSIMLGCGETLDEVREAMADLRAVGCDVITFGQYLRPTAKHLPVDRFVTPEEFQTLERDALGMGFVYCASGPLVRSSYRAGEFYLKSVLRGA
jgi:lipoic acid synthetase